MAYWPFSELSSIPNSPHGVALREDVGAELLRLQ
jgi:hypothetical protein